MQHCFNGLLTLADWIGSDTAMFPLANGMAVDRFAWSAERSNVILRKLGLEARLARTSLGHAVPDFRAVSQYYPNSMQRTIAALPAHDDRGSVTVLESETGSGKTEAALTRFMALFHAGMVDGMYFALPTRTAATQLHTRVTAAVARAFPDAGSRPAVVLAVPGYLAVDDHMGYRRLPGFEVLWNDSDVERWRFRGWAAERPKRYLAGTVVVGTVDQVLLSTLMVPHAHLRATSLMRHLLIVDEVHASDAYMIELLTDVVQRHVTVGGHALLMSATLGAATRARIMGTVTPTTIPSLDEAIDSDYPMITHAAVGGSISYTQTQSSGGSRCVSVRTLPAADHAASIAQVALDAARSGACVLVIRNTVADCVATQEALEELASGRGDSALLFGCGEAFAPHHGRFARSDRRMLDAALEARLGKDGRRSGCVVVATQTVQQSLDIDADLMLSDLCPADVLLQRIGRLHRHDTNTRPAGFTVPVCHVIVPDDRDLGRLIGKDGTASGSHGFGTVYEDLRILEATWRLLERQSEWRIPEMNRELVESAVHPEALDALTEELGELWQLHGRTVRGTVLAHRRLADTHAVDWSIPFGQFAFPSREVAGRISTRLGEGDRLVAFAKPFPGPFGVDVNELIIPAHMVRNAPADAVPLDIEVRDSYIMFRFGDRKYRYDRLGLRVDAAGLNSKRK
jgi:CRISPR-associated endonuclease/helicase Cas3